MRYALTAMLLVGLALGCKKQPSGPQTTEIFPPRRSLDRLSPSEPTPETPSQSVEIGQTVAPAPSPAPPPAAMTEARPPEGPPPPEPGPQVRIHVAQKGDTLWSIAERLLGSGHRWKEIVEMNPGLVPEELRIGQTLRIPGR